MSNALGINLFNSSGRNQRHDTVCTWRSWKSFRDLSAWPQIRGWCSAFPWWPTETEVINYISAAASLPSFDLTTGN